MGDLTFFVAFSAGLLSFFSPCVIPLIPSYVSYITGITYKNLEKHTDSGSIRTLTLINSLLFIAGFSFVFVCFGAAASYLGQLLLGLRDYIRIGGGFLIIFFGLHIIEVLPFRVLDKFIQFKVPEKPLGRFGSFLIGCIFAAAWTPCVGPILGSILVVAGTKQTVLEGVLLLSTFSLGLGIPFLISSLLISSFINYFERIKRYLGIVNFISGLFLILVGVLMLTNSFDLLSGFFAR